MTGIQLQTLQQIISIHAPVKGATSARPFPVRSIRYFNPRSREGSDTSCGKKSRSWQNFNPRSREGSDQYCYMPLSSTRHFNPRSREGSDLHQSTSFRCRRYFNPRSREGSDVDTKYKIPQRIISIHAPVKGATRYVKAVEKAKRFQSTLP